MFLRHCLPLCFALAAVLLAGCSPADAVPFYPVKGELFVNSQPAAGALVILRPAVETDPAAWPAGFPRAVVGVDGAFQVGTYATDDGAPAGEYVMLVEWKALRSEATDPEAASHDRFRGRYMDPATSTLKATVDPQPTQLPRIDLE